MVPLQISICRFLFAEEVNMLFDSKVFGTRIKEVREDRKLTQEQLAEMLNVTTKHLSKIETGLRGPSVQLLISLAEKLDVSADYLLGLNIERKGEMIRDVEAILSACASLKRKI